MIKGYTRITPSWYLKVKSFVCSILPEFEGCLNTLITEEKKTQKTQASLGLFVLLVLDILMHWNKKDQRFKQEIHKVLFYFIFSEIYRSSHLCE